MQKQERILSDSAIRFIEKSHRFFEKRDRIGYLLLIVSSIVLYFLLERSYWVNAGILSAAFLLFAVNALLEQFYTRYIKNEKDET